MLQFRGMFTDPVKNLQAFGLRENMVVADLGAGTGFYAVAASKMVPSGKVYAVEVVRDYLETINSKARDEGIKNIESFWGDVEKKGGTKIADGVIDAIIASNILFQVEDKMGFLEEMRRILKPGGRVLLIDWENEDGDTMIKVGAAISKKNASDLFLKKGFMFEKEIDAGAHHYGMIFIKQ